MKRKSIYYEFVERRDNVDILRSTGFRIMNSLSIQTGIDTVPTAEITIPLEDLPPESLDKDGQPHLALYSMNIYVQTGGITKYKFIGTIDKFTIDYARFSISLVLSHRVARMRDWLMPSGYTVKQGSIAYMIGPTGANLGYSSTIDINTQSYQDTVEFEYRDGAGEYVMDIAFSSVDKLSALNEIMKNTHDLHFIVDLNDPEGDRIIIGKFGTLTNVIISPDPVYEDECGPNPDYFLTMLTEPTYNVDYTSHFNRAAVFCGDIAQGVMHFTLEEMYNHPELQKEAGVDENGEPLFPVGMYNKQIELQPETEWDTTVDLGDKIYNTTTINNEVVYKNYEIVAYANNDNREFYVVDKEQLKKDKVIKHAVYNFGDLTPIPEIQKTEKDPETGESETIEYAITDQDRINIVLRAYLRAVRILKSQRPEDVWQFNCTPLPVGVADGDKVRLQFKKWVMVNSDSCENNGEPVKKEVALVDKDFYITKRTITFDNDVNEILTLTLDSELRYRDTTDSEYELTELAKKAGEDDDSGGSDHLHADVWSNHLLDQYPYFGSDE